MVFGKTLHDVNNYEKKNLLHLEIAFDYKFDLRYVRMRFWFELNPALNFYICQNLNTIANSVIWYAVCKLSNCKYKWSKINLTFD